MTLVCRRSDFGSITTQPSKCPTVARRISRFLFLTLAWIALIDLPLVWSLSAFSSVNGAGGTSDRVLTTGRKNQNSNGNGYCGVIVGKVIIDDYRRPGQPPSEGKISVGGGGPQAAWGAAAALAVLEDQSTPALTRLSTIQRLTPTPPAQPIHFFGPIGQWSSQDDEALQKLLSPVVQYIHLIQEPSLQTPRIQLWHNEQQDIQWQPLNDSWGDRGADALWRNRPSAQDILAAIATKTTTATTTTNNNINPPTIDNLHMILEVGATAAGGGQDGLLLGDVTLMQHTKQVSVEPVAFPEETTGLVSPQDAASCQSTLLRYPKIDLVVPDWHLFEALDTDLFWRKQFPYVAARYGPKGSRAIVTPDAASSSSSSSLLPLVWDVPVATLATPNGMPINPTGAGNAYSAAVSTCLSKGLKLSDAARIGSAVGAVFCEHEQLPPWTWETLERIQEAALEIQQKMATTGTIMKTEAGVDP
jgi:hypothetical protein